MTDIRKMVLSLETALRLQKAGFKKGAYFNYADENPNSLGIYPFSKNHDGLVIPAYTAEELLKYLPAELSVDQDTWVADFKEYVHIEEKELSSYPYARLVIEKAEDEFVVAYRFGPKVIALSEDEKGVKNNLLVIKDRLTEALASLLLMVIEEKIAVGEPF